jgi:hypothetical protein
VTSGLPGPTAPSAGFSAGTGLGNNATGSATSYQPSLTYQTTVPGIFIFHSRHVSSS